MNFLKKGPEVNLSAIKAIKVPRFLSDLYYDLKDRHLLPVAAVLLIAIVVVPIALSQSGGSEEETESAGSASASAAGSPEGSDQLVARSAPRLRKYQRRLSHLSASDPFVQQYVESQSGGETSTSGPAEGSSSSETGGSGSEPSSSPESFTPESSSPTYEPSSEPPPSPAPSNSGEPEGEPHGNLKWFSYAVDVRVVSRGQVSSETSEGDSETTSEPKSTVRHNLPELTMLPSRKTPAFTYMGSTKDGKKALMLVSSDVKAIFGDARCVIGSQTCQLLALEPELPETVVYGNAGKTYTIELRQIHLVRSDKINKAPLGEPPKKQSKEQQG